MQALNLDMGDYSAARRRFDVPFPLPLRYPASENTFKLMMYTPEPMPQYEPEKLPALVADAHPDWLAMYNRAWKIGLGNLRQPESGFIANFMDTAFNDNTFMRDSCFMMMFGHYGQRVFKFMGRLDNFYAKQHDDRSLCREISTYSGIDLFMPLDPSSTGPPIMAWTEWQYYQQSKDVDRLKAVFPLLVACHRWWKDWRTWPDSSYFTTGWGSGMDNQSRVPDSTKYHHLYPWADINMQQAMDCQVLLDMAQVIGRDEFNAELQAEYEHLWDYVNARLWDEESGYYYDRSPEGKLSSVKSIGVYWGLLSDIVPQARMERVIDHLQNPGIFNHPHRVPSQSADHPDYRAEGGYWLSGVWTPTNYMVLRGLTRHGQGDLAYEIAGNHVENVAQVFTDTGTLWENYAPERAAPGKPARQLRRLDGGVGPSRSRWNISSDCVRRRMERPWFGILV